jgi:4-amino-4-deoxy-L-arabinose transferase-like glycosyltransferase
VALVFRTSFVLRVAPFISKDSQSYFLPGWDLLHTGQFELGLRRTPGYPFFVAFALAVFGDDLRGVTLAQHLLGAGTAALTYVLGRLTFGRLAGVAAGLLVAFSAPLLVYEHYVLTEALFTFALTATLVVLTAAWHRQTARLWLVSGLLIGLAALVRPVGQAVLPLALLAAILPGRRRLAERPLPLRHGAVAVTLVLIGFALPIVPWTIRNQLTHNLSTPSTFGRTLIARTAYYDRGFVFYDPQRPPADSDSTRVRGRQIIQQGADDRESDGTISGRLQDELGLDPIGANALMRDLAVEAILRQPGYFIRGSAEFALHIFNGVEVRLRDHEAERRDVEWRERTRHLLMTQPYSEDDFRAASRQLAWYQPARFAPFPLVLFAGGLLGAVVALRWHPALLPGLAAATLVLASAALDGPQERYRYPADPAISVMMTGGVVAVFGLVRWVVGRVRRSAGVQAGTPGDSGSGVALTPALSQGLSHSPASPRERGLG